jgi:hypothetical protein
VELKGGDRGSRGRAGVADGGEGGRGERKLLLKKTTFRKDIAPILLVKQKG